MKRPISNSIKRRPFLGALTAGVVAGTSLRAESVQPEIKVTLPEAHKGTLEIDTMLLDSYGRLPANVRKFYLAARELFAASDSASFTDAPIVRAAREHGVDLMGGPLLGDLRDDGVTVWLRPATTKGLQVRVGTQVFNAASSTKPGQAVRIRIEGLEANKAYEYEVLVEGRTAAEGSFITAPQSEDNAAFRLAFGSCCHKIGVHNPNLFGQIVKRRPSVMMLLGDIAVDDRNNEVNMHRADYQLRDVSKAWSDLVSNVPVYVSWDDHDYFDNDLSGIPKKYTGEDRDAVRRVWHENWNNPAAPPDREGIYFHSRVGPVEIIMLDTRSCRETTRRRERDSYLGRKQLAWLKRVLANSSAPFKVVSSGTMWSDYVSNGKDSWGTWDTDTREELFSFIEDNRIGGVLLVSGDRHGARGFRITRPSGFNFYEFEPATLGGVPGPEALVKNCPEQLFGYHGKDFIACGEFTFDMNASDPAVTFRLIKESGQVLEEHRLLLSQLTP